MKKYFFNRVFISNINLGIFVLSVQVTDMFETFACLVIEDPKNPEPIINNLNDNVTILEPIR